MQTANVSDIVIKFKKAINKQNYILLQKLKICRRTPLSNILVFIAYLRKNEPYSNVPASAVHILKLERYRED